MPGVIDRRSKIHVARMGAETEGPYTRVDMAKAEEKTRSI